MFGTTLALVSERLTDATRAVMEVSVVFDDARHAVADIEVDTLRFQLDPGPSHHVVVDAALARLRVALTAIRRQADLGGSAAAAQAATLVDPFDVGFDRMIDGALADPGSDGTVADRARAEELFDRIEQLVASAADSSNAEASDRVAELEERQHLTLVLSPLLAAVAILLLIVCWRAVRRYRLSIEHLALHDELTGVAKPASSSRSSRARPSPTPGSRARRWRSCSLTSTGSKEINPGLSTVAVSYRRSPRETPSTTRLLSARPRSPVARRARRTSRT